MKFGRASSLTEQASNPTVDKLKDIKSPAWERRRLACNQRRQLRRISSDRNSRQQKEGLWVEEYRTGNGSDRVVAATCAPSMQQTRSLPLPVLYSPSLDEVLPRLLERDLVQGSSRR